MKDIYAAPDSLNERLPSESALFAFTGSSEYPQKWRALIEGRSRFAGFNWAAFFFTTLWLAYRRLYLWALAAFVAGIALKVGLALLVLELGLTGAGFQLPYLLAHLFCVRLPLGLAANVLYYHRAVTRIQGLEDAESQLEAIRERGGTNGVLVVVLVIVLVSLNLLSVMLLAG